MAKTKTTVSKDVRDKIVDLHRLEWATRPSPSSLVRRWQQLVRLFGLETGMEETQNNLQHSQGPPAQESTCTGGRPIWSLPMNIWMIQRRTGSKWCGQMRPKSSSLASTQLAVFVGGGMLPMTPRTPSPNTEVDHKAKATNKWLKKKHVLQRDHKYLLHSLHY